MEPCIGNTISGDSFASQLVVCLTGFSDAKMPTALYNPIMLSDRFSVATGLLLPGWIEI